MAHTTEPGVAPGRFGDSVKYALLSAGTTKQILRNKLPHFHSLPHTLKQFRAIEENNFNCDTGKCMLKTKTKIIIKTTACLKSKDNIHYLTLEYHSFLFENDLESYHWG